MTSTDLKCLTFISISRHTWNNYSYSIFLELCKLAWGGLAMTDASEILAFTESGRGGLTHAKIFWWIWWSVQRPNLSYNGPIKVINLPPKIITFPPKCDYIPSISEHFLRNNFDPPKYVDLCAFYWLSRVAFTHFLSPNSPVCQDWGEGRGG